MNKLLLYFYIDFSDALPGKTPAADQNDTNPFGDDSPYEESDEEPITVIHSTPKNGTEITSVAYESKSYNPFDEPSHDEKPLTRSRSTNPFGENESDSDTNLVEKAPVPYPRTRRSSSRLSESLYTPVPIPRKNRVQGSTSMNTSNGWKDNTLHSTYSLNPYKYEESGAKQYGTVPRSSYQPQSMQDISGRNRSFSHDRSYHRRNKKRRAPAPPGNMVR